MKAIFLLFIILLFGITGCHMDHSSSLEKYKKKSRITPVAVKEISVRENFIHWDENPNNKFFVKKVCDDSNEQSCKSCHQGFSLKDIKGKIHKRSHWNIKLKHAPSEIMNCTTCHNVEEVWSFNHGKKIINANLTPKMCISCHFAQGKDWQIGAHGKRVNGWQSERAVQNCISCHNPHSPSFKKMWPKIAPYRPKNNEER